MRRAGPKTAGLDALLFGGPRTPAHDQHDQDVELLDALIEVGESFDRQDGLTDREAAAFESMRERLDEYPDRTLSGPQREWAQGAADRIGVVPGPAKPVPRGREVPTPAVLKSLPMAPPGRKVVVVHPGPPTFEERFERASDGHINNCGLANGESEDGCQVCSEGCPDRARYPIEAEFQRNGVEGILHALRTGRVWPL